MTIFWKVKKLDARPVLAVRATMTVGGSVRHCLSVVLGITLLSACSDSASVTPPDQGPSADSLTSRLDRSFDGRPARRTVEKLDKSGRVIGIVQSVDQAAISSQRLREQMLSNAVALSADVRAALQNAVKQPGNELAGIVLRILDQRTHRGVLNALLELPIAKRSSRVDSQGTTLEVRTYYFRGRPFARVYGEHVKASEYHTFSGSTSAIGEGVFELDGHSSSGWRDLEPIEFPTDALDEVPWDHPEAASTEQIEQALVAMILLETELSLALDAESQAQAAFEAWLNSQTSTPSTALRTLHSFAAFSVASSMEEDCVAQGLAATSALVLAIGGAVVGQGQLNKYLAAGTGAVLKGIGVSAIAYAGYIAAGVAGYFVYKATQCRFNRTSGGSGSNVVNLAPAASQDVAHCSA